MNRRQNSAEETWEFGKKDFRRQKTKRRSRAKHPRLLHDEQRFILILYVNIRGLIMNNYFMMILLIRMF